MISPIETIKIIANITENEMIYAGEVQHYSMGSYIYGEQDEF